jgi:L-aspartate oxidase
LEGAVFARRAARQAATLPWREHPSEPASSFSVMCEDEQACRARKRQLQHLMWEHAGIVRNQNLLLAGMNALTQLAQETPDSDWECHNMIVVSQLILQAALWRKESRGGHYRSDYPKTQAEWADRRSSNQRGSVDESVGIAAIHS